MAAGFGETLAPRHVGILPDGNRRWARRNSLPDSEAHRVGFRRIPRVLTWCEQRGIEVLSLFMISDENLRRRSISEQTAIFEIVLEILPRILAHDTWRVRHLNWPEFDEADLADALDGYLRRERRLGA